MGSSQISAWEMLAFSPPGWGGVLLAGALSTLAISVCAFLIGLLIGLLGATGKLSGSRTTVFVLNGYTSIIRAVPELILLVGLYYAGTDGLNRLLSAFGLPAIEVNVFVAAVAVLGFVQGAYMTEVLRGAILAVPPGQIEAARAFGFSPFLTFRRVTLPALLPNALPGIANLWMNITKDSALVAVLGYQELALATRIAGAGTKQYFLFFVAAACLYLCITLVSNVFFSLLERRVRRGQQQLA